MCPCRGIFQVYGSAHALPSANYVGKQAANYHSSSLARRGFEMPAATQKFLASMSTALKHASLLLVPPLWLRQAQTAAFLYPAVNIPKL
jgi:hypothetical protein